jgi:chromosome segregation ATPase
VYIVLVLSSIQQEEREVSSDYNTMLKDWLGGFLGDKLEGEIQTKQDILVRLDADVRAREQDLAKIAVKLSQLEAQQKSEIDALDLEEMLMRGRLQAEIIQSSDVKEDLESKIAELQDRWQNSQAALVQIDRQVSELEERKTQGERTKMGYASIDKN